ncbi:MAG: sialate O-acetylesterase [Lentisphaeria bacterium]|nr:sialate O-acetylesterase [Lentisphaeria bacterium]
MKHDISERSMTRHCVARASRGLFPGIFRLTRGGFWLGLVGGLMVMGSGCLNAPAQAVAADPPAAETKPVKVYIMSGQSNMVGMGDVGPHGMTRFNTYVSADEKAEKGCVVSIYKGAFDPTVNYNDIEPVETHHAMVGYWPHASFPEFDGPSTQIARGYIRIDRKGVYSFKSGNILAVDGKVFYRNEPGQEPVSKRVLMEPGTHAITVVHFGRGQTNLSYSHWDVAGTLTTLVKEEGKLPHLLDDTGNWAARGDVLYKGVVSDTWQGPLTVADGAIGPELGFGQVMGDFHDEPVLLIKASIGNRSLGWDILPPGSERYTHGGKVYAGYKDSPASWPEGEEPKPINWYAGKTYDRYTEEIHKILDNFETLYPQFKDRGYEIAGFVWWQGHKDSGSEAHANHYEQNLVNLINAWRKEFKAENAPWTIATVGFHGHKMPDQFVPIFNAQMAVADPKKHPELAGTVKTVDIRDFWRETEVSPKGQDYHYNRNAETYYLVGEALGKAMVELKDGTN